MEELFTGIQQQGEDTIKNLQQQAQGMDKKLPGMAEQVKDALEPAFIQVMPMMQDASAQLIPAMQGAASQFAPAMQSIISQATASAKNTTSLVETALPKAVAVRSESAPAPVPFRDAASPSKTTSMTDGTLIQPKQAILGGFDLEMETIEDNFEKAIAKYNYPYADGVDLEDMGQKGHTIKVRCYFWDEAGHQTYDHHVNLINFLSVRTHMDFMHPKYGLLYGKIEAVSIRHDDRKRCAEVDLTFLEQMRRTIVLKADPDVDSIVPQLFMETHEHLHAKMLAAMKSKLPVGDAGMLSKTLDSAKGLLSQVQEYSESARAFVSSVEGYISIAESAVDGITSPVDSIQATITYATTLPGRILGSITSAVEKVALLYDSVRNFPSRFLSNLDSAFDNLQESFESFGSSDSSAEGQAALEFMCDTLAIVCAETMALEAASLYDEDETTFNEDSADDTGFQVMNIRELEETLALTRERLEDAVCKAREITSLKTMAKALLEHVNKVRLEREKLISVVLDNPMPLHLVCLKYGLPYTDAERLLKINRTIRNPNFTAGEVLVYVR